MGPNTCQSQMYIKYTLHHQAYQNSTVHTGVWVFQVVNIVTTQHAAVEELQPRKDGQELVR